MINGFKKFLQMGGRGVQGRRWPHETTAMTHRKKDHQQIRKLVGFFKPVGARPQQNGGGSQPLQQHGATAGTNSSGISAPGTRQVGNPHSRESSGSSSPSTRSPVKTKPCRDSPLRHQQEADMELGHAQAPAIGLPQSTTDPIDAFHTLGKPILDTVLKGMLLSLRLSSQAGLCKKIPP